MAKKKPFRFLWITDPWDTLDHPKDTTLRLAEEAIVQGHESWWCDVRSIQLIDEQVVLDARRVTGVYPGRAASNFNLAKPERVSPLEFNQLHYRVDPPVDLAYIQPLQLLELGLRSKKNSLRSKVVNPSTLLMSANEKMEASKLGDLAPATRVSSQWEELSSFGLGLGVTVAKPLNQAQSRGVTRLDWKDLSQCKRTLGELTEQFTRPVVLQEYLPGIARGETRLWFLDGQLLTCARKLPLDGDFRVQIDGGSRIELHSPSKTEKLASKRIGAHLRELGVRLAAVDLIDGKVTDFNFTSPGLLVQIEGLTAKNWARVVIQSLVKPPPGALNRK